MTIPNLGRGGLPVYSPTGSTLTVSNGSTTPSFTGTAFITTDPTTGALTYAVGVGDTLVVSGIGSAVVESVPDATHVVLGSPWTAATQTAISNSGTPGWYIIRNSVPAYGVNAKAIQDLIAIGSDPSPDNPSRTIDNGVSRMKFRFTSGGVPEIAVGPTGTADASLHPAIQMAPATGAVSFPYGPPYTFQVAAGYRNLLINGGFDIWQRGTNIPVTHTSNIYTADRWRVFNQTGGTVTVRPVAAPDGFRNAQFFGGGGIAMQITFTGGGGTSFDIAQIVEASMFRSFAIPQAVVPIYLSFDCSGTTNSGTLSGAVLFGTENSTDSFTFNSFATIGFTIPSSPGTITIPFTAAATEFLGRGLLIQIRCTQSSSSGTVTFLIGNVQLEMGTTVNPFENRPLEVERLLCKRFYQNSYEDGATPGSGSTTTNALHRLDATTSNSGITVNYWPRLRAVPTVSAWGPNNGTANKFYNLTANSNFDLTGTLYGNSRAIEFYNTGQSVSQGDTIGISWAADAEIYW